MSKSNTKQKDNFSQMTNLKHSLKMAREKYFTRLEENNLLILTLYFYQRKITNYWALTRNYEYISRVPKC